MKFLPLMTAFSALLTYSASAQDQPVITSASVLEKADKSHWQTFDPANTLYVELDKGRVLIALSPEFTPGHVDNVKKLVKQGFYDGLDVYRVQENYVVQWGDASGEKDVGDARRGIKEEFETDNAETLAFTPLPGPDGYAAQTGFSGPFPAGKTEDGSQAWMLHCPGAVGMGRDIDPDSGGTELYAVIGHAPRHLDRNVTVFGRVIWGMEYFSTLPRGHGALGFHEDEEDWIPITSIKLGGDLPEDERINLEYLRTDTALFKDYIESRKNRRDGWFHYAANHVDACNFPLPIREVEQD